MIEYMNLKTGRVLERPAPDPWLDASGGWTRLHAEPAPEPPEANDPPVDGGDEEDD